MTYRVTITSAMGLYVMGLVIAGFLIATGLLLRPVEPGLLIAGVAVLAWLAAIRLRYLVRVSGEEMQARNLVGESRMKWHEIVRVAPVTEGGYWPCRLFGPYVLEFVSQRSRLRVNFKLFPGECLQDVMRHVPPGAKVPG